MTKGQRKLLFLFFVLAFFIITPLITLYAVGYKINLTWPLNLNQTLQKTGVFVFDTSPPGAKIYLNEEPIKNIFGNFFNRDNNSTKTPARIKNMLPGEYNVTIDLEGYWPWQKKLKIESGQATFAEDIFLFKKNIPLLIESASEKNAAIHSSNKYLYLLEDKKIKIINTQNDEKKVFELNENIPSNLNHNQISILNDQIIYNNYLINSNSNKLVNLEKIIGPNIKNAKFGTNNENKIYYQLENTINSFNLLNNANQVILSGQEYIDYFVKNDNLFIISRINDNIQLRHYKISNNKLIKEINLPFSDKYEFIQTNHRLINLYDEKFQILYLIDPFANVSPLVEVISNIKFTNWTSENNLIYANDFELWTLNLEHSKKTLLTRISRPIEGILGHPNNNYLIFSTEENISTLEFDDREKRIITELIKLTNISSPIIDKEGNILYFLAKIGNQEGLYKLYLQ